MAELMTNAEEDFYRSQTELAKEQKEFLKKQQEFIELQKRDLIESKKDREITNRFTFVLAFGVIVSIFFSLFQIIIKFKESSRIHLLVISAIFIYLFLFGIDFIFHTFPMKKEMQSYLKKRWFIILAIFVFVVIFMAILFLLPDNPLN